MNENLKNDLIDSLNNRFHEWELWWKENSWYFKINGQYKWRKRQIEYLRNDYKKRIKQLTIKS